MIKNITILAMPDTQATTITGIMDVLQTANKITETDKNQQISPVFNTRLASWDGNPVHCDTGFQIMPETSLENCQDADLIVLSSVSEKMLSPNADPKLCQWLIRQYKSGTALGAICSGVFFLAQTGLLSNCQVTTHWQMADYFNELYPDIDLNPEKMVTESDRIFCAGGASAGMDMGLYLIEKQYGTDLARKTAKAMVIDISRPSQGVYAEFSAPKKHEQDAVLDIQEWIEDNFEQRFSYDELALGHALSRRTLERKFKNATGLTPLGYQHHIRVQACKKLLETTRHRFEEITAMVGYEDTSSFRKIFQKLVGTTPGDYRRRFGRPES